MSTEFTKQLLIEKSLQYWKETFDVEQNEQIMYEPKPNIAEINESAYREPATHYEQSQQVLYSSTAPQYDEPEQFPINQMARKFATWFFGNLNSNQLKVTDFWNNCTCKVQFLEQKQCLMNDDHVGAEAVLNFCQSLQQGYNLYLNLNANHSGTQGRIDCHGLVLVLSCGTLHKINQIVGTFECVFGLSRDPFSENNWKMNQINLRLHNFVVPKALSSSTHQPALVENDYMQPLLSMDMPNGQIG